MHIAWILLALAQVFPCFAVFIIEIHASQTAARLAAIRELVLSSVRESCVQDFFAMGGARTIHVGFFRHSSSSMRTCYVRESSREQDAFEYSFPVTRTYAVFVSIDAFVIRCIGALVCAGSRRMACSDIMQAEQGREEK